MIIYIAGYGRSGSTLLDVTLNAHPEIFGAGELTWLFRRAADGHACTCGIRLEECEIWGKVLASVRNELPDQSLESLAAITLQCERLLPIRSRSDIYDRAWSVALDQLRRITGCEWIVDSSKSNRIGLHRYQLLSQLFHQRIRMLHLVRPVGDVLRSLRNGTNKSLAEGDGRPPIGGALRGLASWTFSNLAAECQTKHLPHERLIVDYEELVQSPQDAVRQIGEFLTLRMECVMDMLAAKQPMSGGHGVDGNRMRRSANIRLLRQPESVELPPFSDRALASLVRPLERRYRAPARLIPRKAA
ncbi:MAG: sulfotransferase [Candidatus Paceibacterota bacterium]